MSIKNGDMPAIPQPCTMNENGDMVSISEWTGEVGLTKRETFAMNAPDIPDWFELEFLQNPKLNKGNDYVVITGYEGSTSQEGCKAMFIAWRTYYADALLAQLEEKGE